MNTSPPWTIRRRTPASAEPALVRAADGWPEHERDAQVHALLQRTARREAQFLLDAQRRGPCEAAVWAEQFPGRTAVLTPPAGPAADAAAGPLLAELHRLLEEAGVELVQASLTPAQRDEAVRLTAAGYHRVAELLYLAAPLAVFPDASWRLPFTLEPYRPGPDDARLVAIIDATYERTLDCPALDGLRATEDVLAGYRAIGAFDPARWLIVRHAGRDVGCLLLSAHSETLWELVYFGLAPEARGRGWGLELVRWAQWLTRASGGEQLVLSVDAANHPARRNYEQAGFRAWELRQVYVYSLRGAAKVVRSELRESA